MVSTNALHVLSAMVPQHLRGGIERDFDVREGVENVNLRSGLVEIWKYPPRQYCSIKILRTPDLNRRTPFK